MISTTAGIVGSAIKVSGTGVVVVAGTDVSTVGMTAGRNLVAPSSSTPSEIIRPWVRMVIVNGRCG